MLTNQTIRKLFKGNGVALGGHLRQPFTEPIPSQASAVIPISGGLQTVRAEAFRHREIISFRSAYTLVSGHEADSKLHTLAMTVIEGLDILGVVTAGKIVARLSGSIDVKDGANPIVTPSGSYFEDLRICGELVKCRFIGDCFDELTCDDKYLDSVRSSDKIRPQLLPAKGWEAKGFVPVSLCAGVAIGERKGQAAQFHFDVPHFGRVFLSEFIVSRNSHHLTMLRVDLGCSVDGSLTAGSVEGEPYIMP